MRENLSTESCDFQHLDVEKMKNPHRRLRREASEKTGENGVTEDKRKKVSERGKGPLCQMVFRVR